MFSLLKAGVDRLSYLVTEILPFQTLRSAHKLELNITVLSYSQRLEFQCPAQYSSCWESYATEGIGAAQNLHLQTSPLDQVLVQKQKALNFC